VAANKLRKVTLKPKKASGTAKILDALAAKQKVKAKITAKFSDAAGNTATTRKAVRLK
jgi:hypothetical protein